MAVASTNPIIVVSSSGFSSTVSNVVIFSPTEPTARDNGGDLINGDRWINTELLTESIWYYGRWLLIGTLDLGGDIDGGNSGPHPEKYVQDMQDHSQKYVWRFGYTGTICKKTFRILDLQGPFRHV